MKKPRRPKRIDPSKLAELINEGLTYAEIAGEFGVTVSGVKQAVKRLGMGRREYLRHDKFVPWKIATGHDQTGPITYLRVLSTVAQGRSVPIAKWNTAYRWADELVQLGLDIDYDRERGFYERPAIESKWHLKNCLEEADKAFREKIDNALSPAKSLEKE